MSETTNFLLSKWYLDCVAEDGVTFIGYAAHLRWKALSLHFSSILIRRSDGDVHTETSLLRGAFPRRDGSTISWVSRPLNMKAEWTGLLKPIERHLYKDDGGEIVWSCLLPMAEACVNVRRLAPIEGLGYVEHMTLSIPAWRLPITELRWGRFLTGGNSLVWIDWKGEVLKTLVLLNGEEVGAASVTDSEVRGDKGLHLSLARNAIVRHGPIVSTTLSMIPGIGKILGNNVLQMHECKWLSKGDLLLQGSPAGSGWALHELVKFP